MAELESPSPSGRKQQILAPTGPALVKVAPGRGHLRIEERSAGRPQPQEVRVAVAATGVCGTDLHIADGEWPCSPPVVLGHEVAGTVEVLGAGVDEGWRGARVACETFFSTDETCDRCREGLPNLCGDRRSIGSGVDGGFARHVVVPVRNLHRIPDWLRFETAVLLEPLACVCNCLLDPAEIASGDRVLVVGAGPIGLLAALVARRAGARVLVLGRRRDVARLEVAKRLRFEATSIDDTADVPRPGSADVVIECAGSASAVQACLAAVRPGGRYVQIGLAGAAVEVEFDQIVIKQLTVRGGLAAPPRAWWRALELVGQRWIHLEALVTRVVPLRDWREAFDAARHGDVVKVVLDPWADSDGGEMQ